MKKGAKVLEKIADTKVARKAKNLFTSNLQDLIRGYLNARSHGNEMEYINNAISKLQEEVGHNSNEQNVVVVQKLIFLNLMGFDTSWGNFTVLEVMTLEDYSAKRVAYTAAAQMWNNSTDAVLMATNRIQRDLTSVNTLLTSTVLTSIAAFLTPALAAAISQDVISLMTSSKPYIRQKAIMLFYHVCLQYPDALKPGFVTLRQKLDDDDYSVMFSALSVIAELCAHNPQNFVPLIPKLHKMLEGSPTNWVALRIVAILRMLCSVEPRLPKKLITPFTTLLETTSSITLLFECVRSIIEIPITNTVLLTYAAQRMNTFLEHKDVNLRYLCLTQFMKLMEIQPKLVSQHKELISECLDSSDEPTRLMALDLLASLANSKTLDGIVAKMFDHFRESKSTSFKNQLMTRVVEICSREDYALVQDFDWYITILMDFVNEGGMTVYDLLADQFLDLALRVPATRNRLVDELSGLLKDSRYKNETRLVLAISHIVGDYSSDAKHINDILPQTVTEMNERVQTSCVSTAFKLYLKSEEEGDGLEQVMVDKLEMFSTSPYAEVQDMASMTKQIILLLQGEDMDETFEELALKLTPSDTAVELEEIPKPAELDEPVDLFKPDPDDNFDEFKDEADEEQGSTVQSLLDPSKEEKKPRRRRIARQKQTEKAVVIKSNERVLHTTAQTIGDAKKQTNQPKALSNALAEVNLASTIADMEAKANQPKIPFDHSLQMKRKAAAEAAAAAAAQKKTGQGKRRRHGEGSSQEGQSGRRRKHHSQAEPEAKPAEQESQDKPKLTLRRRRVPGKPQEEQQPQAQEQAKATPSGPPVTGPVPGARHQLLGENDDFSVTAVEFHVDPLQQGKLTIDLLVQNKGFQDLKSVQIEMVSQAEEGQMELLPIDQVPSHGQAESTISLAVSDQFNPHLYKFRFIPMGGGEPLEATLRVFPSFFLLPGTQQEYEAAKEQELASKEMDLTQYGKPKELLQLFVNVLRGTILPTEDIKIRTLFSKTLDGNQPVIAVLRVEKPNLILEIKCANETLLGILMKEIERKLAKEA